MNYIYNEYFFSVTAFVDINDLTISIFKYVLTRFRIF